MRTVTCCLLLLLATFLHEAHAAGSAARLWRQVTPAAGVELRSAVDFRVTAVSGGATRSIDVYQRNADGTATRLDTVSATPAGASGGPYHTTNMAAVFWQMSAAPAASNTPPDVAVTFINDQPAVALNALFPNGAVHLPFAAGDASLLLDLDLRNGVPGGWQSSGSGSFDSASGYRPGIDAGAGLSNTAVPALSRTGQMSSGTIAVRLQRTGIALDNTLGTQFWDSTGNTRNAYTQNRQLLGLRSNSGGGSLVLLENGANLPSFLVQVKTNGMAQANVSFWETLNSHAAPQQQDPVWADVAFSWFQNQYYVYVDGHLVFAGSLGDVPAYTMFQNICIGNDNGSGAPAGAPFGNYYVQRVQISSRFLGPVLAGPLLGLLPDSFAQGYTQRVDPSGADGSYQVAAIDAAQNALGLYGGMSARTLKAGQTASFHQIQALMFQNYGFFPPIYNAGQAGHGYSQQLAPMDDAFIAALNRAQPAIIMAGGTVNDVSISRPAHATLVADTQAAMSRLAAGGGTRIVAPSNPRLEQIIYLETLSSQGMPSAAAYVEPAYQQESQAVIAATRAGMAGFKPANGVAFSYLTSREWWDGAADYASYLYGSNPANPYRMSGGNDYLNVHPDATGFSVIAAHLYAPVSQAILQAPVADLSVKASGTQTAAGVATFDLTVANAGPQVAGNTTVSTTLPAGVNIVSGSSSSGCSQTGRTLTCVVGGLLPAASSAVRVALQASPPAPVVLSFGAASLDSYDAASANDSVSVTAAPPATAPTASDAPLPAWVLMALGLAFLAVTRRRTATR